MTERKVWHVIISLIFSILATVAFLYFGYRALGYFLPFVIGWMVSSIATPLVNWLDRRLRIVKRLGSALIVILVLLIIFVILYLLISRLITEIGIFMTNLPYIYQQVEIAAIAMGHELSATFDRLPEGIQTGLETFAQNLNVSASTFISDLSHPTMNAAGTLAANVTTYIIGFFMAILSAYFFTAQKEEILNVLKTKFPKAIVSRMTMVVDNLKHAVGGYVKAQLIIMVVIFVILCIPLGIFHVRSFILIAFLIAFLDLLPFFGTGIVLGPWAIYQFIMGDMTMGIVLVVTYIITQIARHLLQPKLVADQVGLHPLVALFLIFLGYRLGGFLWMILAIPAGMIVINMYKAGAFDYMIDDVKILLNSIMKIRGDHDKFI